jgi:hypothetical protein
MADFKINKAALDEARDHLGIEAKVRVFICRMHCAAGRYVGMPDGVHHISLANWMSLAEAEGAIWHELQHAAQVERVGGHAQFDMLWMRQMERAGFDANSFKGGRVLTQPELSAYNSAPFEMEANLTSVGRPSKIKVCVSR